MPTADSEFIQIQSLGDDSAPKPPPKSLPDVLPLLGLSDIVVFPGMVAPLVVDSSQSIKLIDDVVAGDRLVGLVLQKSPEVDKPGPEDLWGYGCAARVLKMLKFPDNTVRVLVEGLRRFKISSYKSLAPYLVAKVDILKDSLENSVELKALTRNAGRQFQEIVNLSPTLSEQIKISALNTEEPGPLTDLIAANLNLGLEERESLLETHSVKDRLVTLLPLLGRELEVLTLGSKIQNEVASAMSKSQREFFLREQLRAIHRELGEGDPAGGDIGLLRSQLEALKLPEEPAKVAARELERLQQTPPSSAEYLIGRNYLDWLLNLPWNKQTVDKLDLDQARRLLNSHHFGLDKVKDRLLEFLAVIKLKHEIKGPILCLVGPPGVGKTSLGKSVAEALGRKFARISLGGLHDEGEIRGHRRTYVGALPGRIIQTLRRCESRNPVILLDEIDKLGADFRGDPSAALLEVLDPSQNNTFTDHYLDVPFDLSRVLFITTANWLDPISPALRDRLEVIEIPSYTSLEKLRIARRHLVPRQLKEHGLNSRLVRFPGATIQRVIQDYTRESGVRQLDREIASLSRKAARQLASHAEEGHAVVFKAEQLAGYLGPPKFISHDVEKITRPGIAIGLAWTPVGGEILFIEATRMPGKGALILTGSLGEVMKESAQAALSFLRSHAESLGIDLSDFEKKDIHIHVPAGATPKDGPSAGVTIVSALASLLTGRLVRSNLAMTGEISLRGRVLSVGGIKEKVLAAARSGLREVILPADNKNDWLEVPEEVRRRFKAHFVHSVTDVFKLAFAPVQKSIPRHAPGLPPAVRSRTKPVRSPSTALA